MYGRARYHSDRRTHDYLETKLDLHMDVTPLFTWNTKQVFLSLVAAYETPQQVRETTVHALTQPENGIVFWDKIVTSRDAANVTVHGLRNKYGMRSPTKTFEYVLLTLCLTYPAT